MKSYTIQQLKPEQFEDFIDILHYKFPNFDIYESDKPFDLKDHYHKDFESRLFLEGEATFEIYGEKIHCKEGTYIEIYPNVVHSFECETYKPLRVMRFFKKEKDWTATFV